MQPDPSARVETDKPVGSIDVMETTQERQHHWDTVYRGKRPTEVSWFQSRPRISLDLIRETGVPPDATIVDIGGGASTLVDHLLDEGRTSVLVLDVSEAALARLAPWRVTWIIADVTDWQPPCKVDIWHDRAVLHVLSEAADQNAHAGTAKRTVTQGGWAIIAGFAPGGPRKCSGLDIVQHDARGLRALLGNEFKLVDAREELHRTPAGASQAFCYHLFRRMRRTPEENV